MTNQNDLNKIEKEKVATFFKEQLLISLKTIDRLGTVLKGNQPDFDQRLVKLRKSVQKTDDYLDLESPLTDFTNTISDVENSYQTTLRELRNQTLEAGTALQKTKGMDDNVRRKLRMVVNRINSTDGSVLKETFENNIEVLQLYVLVLQEKKKLPEANQDSNQTTNIKVEKQEDFNLEMIKKLVDGLKALSNNELIKPSLNSFVGRVTVTDDPNVQLDICLQYFEEIVGRFVEEFSQTQSLINQINKALADVHNTLVASLKLSKSFDAEISTLNKQIDSQIKALSSSTQSANSLEELKGAIEQKLTVINVTIQKRDELEQNRAEKIQDTVSKLEAKLSGLEQRTEYYRQKWLEEKTRSGMDTLTGLPNRGAYDKKIADEFQRWQRHPQPLTIAVIDIDHFKKINDSFGHSVGDKTLKIVSKTIRKQLRTTDFLARYGGEEFVALFVNTDHNQVVEPLEKIRKAVEKIPFKVKDTPLNITISIGHTTFLAADNVHTAFDRADKALYKAKNSGRNRVCFK